MTQVMLDSLRKSTTPTEGGKNVTIGTGSTAILAENAKRIYACITNDSDEVIYISLGEAAVAGDGIPLRIPAAAGGELARWEMNQLNLCTSAINGICASGGKDVSVVEW